MKCANCTSAAIHEYKISQNTSVLYCNKHLPKFLDPLRKAGNLTIGRDLEPAAEPASEPSVKPKKKNKAPEPQVTIEPEPVVEPEVSVEPELLPE